jgi:hypothetical protein
VTASSQTNLPSGEAYAVTLLSSRYEIESNKRNKIHCLTVLKLLEITVVRSRRHREREREGSYIEVKEAVKNKKNYKTSTLLIPAAVGQ